VALHPNVERFRTALNARARATLNEDDAAAVEDVLASDVAWHGAVDGSGDGVTGRDAALAAWTAFGQQGTQVEVGEVYADDIHVTAVLEYSSGSGPSVRQVNVFHLDDDGKVEQFWGLPTDTRVAEALATGTTVPDHPKLERFQNAERARARATFVPEDVALLNNFFMDEVVWHSGGKTEWNVDPESFDAVIKRYKGFKAATGGTLKLEILEAFADDTHAVSLVRLTAERPGHPDKHMDVKECLVFHLTPEGKAYEFWGIPHDADERDAFWIDDRPQEVIRAEVATALGLPALLTKQGTDGQLSMLEVELPPLALLAPVHTHVNQDEASYILEGELNFYLDGEVTTHRAGEFAFKPKGVPHTIFNTSDKTARFLEFCWPGGLDEYLEDLADAVSQPGPPDPKLMAEIAQKHGIFQDFASIDALVQQYGVHQLGM
jgi:quercetin dioxygenase-like cupin family protein